MNAFFCYFRLSNRKKYGLVKNQFGICHKNVPIGLTNRVLGIFIWFHHWVSLCVLVEWKPIASTQTIFSSILYTSIECVHRKQINHHTHHKLHMDRHTCAKRGETQHIHTKMPFSNQFNRKIDFYGEMCVVVMYAVCKPIKWKFHTHNQNIINPSARIHRK